jgi:hypothetical protein
MIRTLPLALVALLELGGCYQSTPSHEMTLMGRVDRATFPYDVSRVQLRDGAGDVSSVTIGDDATFRLTLAEGTRVRLAFEAPTGAHATLVYPRREGRLESWLDVQHAGGWFDLGRVRYLGDPADVDLSAVFGEADTESNGCGGDDEGDDGEWDDHEGDDQDGECVDAAGTACSGTDDGDGTDGWDAEDDFEGDAAIAEHDVPRGGVCGPDDGDDGEHDGEEDGRDD